MTTKISLCYSGKFKIDFCYELERCCREELTSIIRELDKIREEVIEIKEWLNDRDRNGRL